jgi:predicted PurR-regulated permease PerM
MKMHTVLAFISIVGGLILFGSSGLILGPVSLTITTALLEIWRNRMSVSQHENGREQVSSHRFSEDSQPEACEPDVFARTLN